MNNRFYLIIILIIGTVFSSQAQQFREAPINPEFLDFQKEVSKGKYFETTQSGHTLGLIPLAYEKDVSVPIKKTKRDKIQAPPQYDLRNVGGVNYVSAVTNQGPCGSCWAFAAAASLESVEMFLGYPEPDLSEQNIKNCHGFVWGHCSGGNSEIAMSYVSRIDGPISEADDPYNPYVGTCASNKTAKSYFTNGWYLPNYNSAGYEQVLKELLLEHGSIFTSMTWDNAAYNSSTNCFRYTSTMPNNHAVLLVGWDDNKDMSSVGASTNGAWIIKNSWGTGFGESGFFYISYEDTKVHGQPALWTQRLSYNADASLYQHDELGGISGISSGGTTGYGLVKYIANSNQIITKIGTWANKASSSVTIEVWDDFDGSVLSGRLAQQTTQSCTYAGYYTFDLDTPVELTEGNDFYIKVLYDTPGYYYSIPVEKVITNYCNPEIESGVCWLSADGSNWTPIGANTGYQWDLCIRAYALDNNNVIAAPKLITPEENANDIELTPRLDWSDVDGINSYELQISALSDFSIPIIIENGLTSSQFTVPSGKLEENTEYHWRVRSVYGLELSRWESRRFNTINTLLPPDIVSPSDKEKVSLTPNLDWTDINGAENYELQISDNNSFINVIFEETNILSSEFTLPDNLLNENVEYFWRVRVKVNSDFSQWNSSSFITLWTVKPPSLIYPSYANRYIAVNCKFDWEDIPEAELYRLQISTNSDFTNIIYDNSNISTSEYQMSGGTLSFKTYYYWRVNVHTTKLTTEWSSLGYFRTQSVPRPVTISPRYNEKDVSLTKTMDWSDVEYVDSYELMIAKDSRYSDVALHQTGITESEYTIPANTLENATLYYWRVRSKEGNYTSTWSSYRKFTTAGKSGPELLLPAANATGIVLEPTLSWNSYTDAEFYELMLSDNSSFSNPKISITNINGLSYDVPANTLEYNKLYYWRVRAKADGEFTAWSPRQFTTLQPAVAVPVLVYPVNNATDISLTPTLNWSDVSDADSYEVILADNASFTNPIVEESELISSDYKIPSNSLVTMTKYYWKVRAVKGNATSPWTNYYSFTTGDGNDILVTLISPSNSTRNTSLTLTLDWADVTDADSYDIQVSKYSDFRFMSIDESGLASSAYSVQDGELLYSTYYYWRVRFTKDNSTSEWNEAWRFRTIYISRPSLVSPSYRATNVELTPTLNWRDVTGADSYELQLSTTSNYSNIVASETNLTSSDFTVGSGTFDYLTKYYWKVRVKIGSQYSSWSSSRYFTTRNAKAPTPETDVENLSLSISLYPNPIKDYLNVEFEAIKGQAVELRLTDLLGNEIYAMNRESAGSVAERIDFNDIPSGVYLLQVSIGEEKYIRKVVKQ